MAGYRSRLADGPTITLVQSKDSLAWSYDPTELVGYDLYTTIYPSGNFSAPWGKLAVERGGVLVRNDFSWIRIGAPTGAIPAEQQEIRGDGWTLSLNPGWTLHADPTRRGGLIVTKDR
jgi:hypothetical protein